MMGATRTSLPRGNAPSFESSSRRRSTLLNTPASNRRLSFLSNVVAPSSLQAASQLSSNQPPRSHQKMKDSRPLRDKAYVEMLIAELYDFLVANRFDIEMNHSLSLKSLHLPTQKDFVLMFHFLYNKLDPHYTFSKSIETEVFQILRAWDYPYLDSISRTQISAVGQNWPVFLAMLYWLMKLNLGLSGLTEDDMIASDDPFDRLFIKYTHQTYGAYIDQEEDYSQYYDQLTKDFDRVTAETIKEKEARAVQIEELRQERDSLRGLFRILEEAQAKSEALENDLKQFTNYMNDLVTRKESWGEILRKMEEELVNLQNQLSGLQQEKKNYENAIIQRGLSPSEIDSMNSEREKLARSLERNANKLKDVQENIEEKLYALHQIFDSLVSFVSQYNVMTKRIPSENYLFEIEVNSTLPDSKNLFEPENILSKRLLDEKIKLLQCRTALTQEIRRTQEEKLRLNEQLDQVSVTIFEQQESLESVRDKCRKTQQMASEIYELMTTESKGYSAQIEKLDRELQGLRLHVNTGIIEAESNIKSLQFRRQETSYRIKEERERLHETVQRIIDYVITFKCGIQEGLEDLDLLALRELEAEQKQTRKSH